MCEQIAEVKRLSGFRSICPALRESPFSFFYHSTCCWRRLRCSLLECALFSLYLVQEDKHTLFALVEAPTWTKMRLNCLSARDKRKHAAVPFTLATVGCIWVMSSLMPREDDLTDGAGLCAAGPWNCKSCGNLHIDKRHCKGNPE